MNLCPRHDDALVMALELRGLLQPTLTQDADLTPLRQARQAIAMHATHFAGRASLELITAKTCPLCFVNKNPAGINLDGWIENAAEEALADATRRADGVAQSLIVHH